MPITYEWYNEEKTVIRINLSGDWGWQDYFEIQPDLIQMIDTVEHTVHYVVDISETSAVPTGSMMYLPRIYRQSHPRRGITITVGASNAFIRLFEILRRAFPPLNDPRYIFCNTMDEANGYIRKMPKTGQP